MDTMPGGNGCCSSGVEVEPGVRLPEICELQHAIIQHSSYAIIATDVDGTIIYFNPAAQQLLGYRWEELVGRCTPGVFHVAEEIAAKAEELSERLGRRIDPGFCVFIADLAGGIPCEHVEHDWTYVHKDGRRFPVALSITALHDCQGELIGYLGIASDISERRAMESELRIAATAFESQAAIMVTDAEQRILRVNPAFSRLTGYSAEEAIGRLPSILKSGRQDSTFYAEMWTALQQTGHWQGEIWNRRKSGEVFPEWLTITAICDERGQLTNYVSTFSDISNLKMAESEIHNLAFYDPLTSLPNRRLLLNRLHKAQIAGGRTREYGALLVIDLDNFKTLNDTLGHDVGDRLLVEVANRLKSCVRDTDTAARQGGDEFAVMLDDLGQESGAAGVFAENVAEKIRSVLAQPYVLGREAECFHTASIGITLYCGDDKSIDLLFKQADIALYKAKDAGRNTIRFFDTAMQTALEQRARLERGLRHALRRDELRLVIQPQVANRRRIVGAELLLRWQPADQWLVMPAEFIPLAEETGLIVDIGQWVMEQACTLLRRWQAIPEMRDLYLAVNVSPRQFHQPDFVERVQRTVAHHGIDPRRLKLELTESLLLEAVDDVVAKMRALADLGVCFSLDDFGTGYASLSYLKRFPFDQLKVDRSFVRDLGVDSDDAAIVRAIIAMGNALRLNVVAEGVETEEQYVYLAEHGCHAFQGYLFGRPMSLADFEALSFADAGDKPDSAPGLCWVI
ncbi:EAL domain-containing protein [Azonexus sp. IMCC34839]|uniref:sensor domain-containing protein n=1 Tax=Azonexus sp. IMCC34839 TaxID=3133695 RepID=UPI003999C150